MNDDFQYLNLKEWPFRVVPSYDSASVWVGRPDALRRFQRIARRAGSAAVSELILLWAGFGAGKTHALRYLENLARQDPKMMPLYVATPKGARSFADLYATVIDAVIESGALEAAGRDLFDRTKGNISSDLERAVIRIAHYAPEEAMTAKAWLRGDKVYLRDLRDIGISARIENSQDAVRALNGLIQILQRDGNVTVLLFVDEVQELGELTDRQLDECIGGFQKVFNQNENGLTLLMSFTSGSQATLKRVIGEALYDRAGQTLTLTPLEHQEAIDFLNDLLKSRAIDKSRAPWPFTADALEAVVDHVERQETAVSPRAVIKAADLILKDAALDIEDGEIDEVSREYAETVLIGAASGSMTEDNGLDLVAAGDVGSLLRRLGLRGWDPASASEQGLIHRQKIAGWWLYAENEAVMDQARSSFASEADRIVHDWFLGNPKIVARSAAKSIEVSIGSGAADALMRYLIEVGRYGRLPVFNQSLIPYFAVHALDRQNQVEVALTEVTHLLATTGVAQARDLTTPTPAPTTDVWRQLVLAHADYLGWGSLEADSLKAWASL